MNKKSGAVARLVIWGAVALLLTAVLVLFLTNRGQSLLRGMTGQNGFGSGDAGIRFGTGYSYSDSGDYQLPARTGSTAVQDIESVEIHWISGSVSVQGGDQQDVTFSEDYSGAEKYRLHYREKDGKLIIQPCASEGFLESLVNGLPDKALTVTVPRALAGAVEIDAVSADVDAGGFKADSFSAETASGGVTLQDVGAGSMEFETVSGGLRGSGVTADTLDAETTSGGAELDGRFGGLELTTVSGELRFTCAEAPRALNADTTSGDVTLYLPKGSSFRLDWDTVSGDLDNEFGSGGSAEYSVDTVSGNLTLRSAGR